LLTARVEGTETIVTTQTALLYDNVSGQDISVYSLDVPGDDPDTPEKDGGLSGDKVYFEIEYEELSVPMTETGVWNIGDYCDLDLTVPMQATLSGQPTGVVDYNTANVVVGGGHVMAYKYKVDNGSWSEEAPVENHLLLSGLGDGMHAVYVIGRSA
jgi:hypothetical protein